jgi:microcystin-dependent protein
LAASFVHAADVLATTKQLTEVWMSEPFLSEIKIMSFNFPPKGWALCNGQLLPINQNQALFSLLGTTYGGDGRQTFALPNLRGQVPMHMGSSHTLGERGGAAAVTVNIQQLPTHTHPVMASATAANTDDASAGVLAQAGQNMYGPYASPVSMAANSVSNAGGSQPHNNMAPYLVLNFCIALIGIFPSQN